MARFGRDLVRSLTQPSFTEGLFTVGERVGGLPEASRKKEQTQGMLKELSAAQASGDTSALADLAPVSFSAPPAAVVVAESVLSPEPISKSRGT